MIRHSRSKPWSVLFIDDGMLPLPRRLPLHPVFSAVVLTLDWMPPGVGGGGEVGWPMRLPLARSRGPRMNYAVRAAVLWNRMGRPMMRESACVVAAICEWM
jgi:hypothetical protein